VCRPQGSVPRRIDGMAGAPGLAVGQGVVVFGMSQIGSIPDRLISDIQAEEARLREAIRGVREETVVLNAELEGSLSEVDRALFGAYELLLDSPEILETALTEVRKGNWAPGSVSRAFESYAARFDAMPDTYLRERAADIRALGGRILTRLLGETSAVKIGQAATVLVAPRLSALDIGQAQSGNLVGVVSGDGSPLSHAAILARALGIPAVVGVSGLPLAHLDGQELAVDGTAGQVHLNLTPPMRKAFEQSIENQRDIDRALEPVRGLDAVTADGVNIELFINAGLSTDLEVAKAAGSAGIGLYRTELPFMLFDRLPAEQEQVQIYRHALQTMSPLPVTLRTLDVGGDKQLPYLHGTETNTTYGQRGVRFMLDHPEIFLTQVRAALRADLGLANLRLLLPMISGVDELDEALRLLEQAKQQLVDEGLSISRPSVGVMIEVPAVVYQVEALARRVDFLSIGTNDLTQYLLATDRNDPQASARLDPVHPALLQALKQIAESAQRAGKPVTVCGEIAGDPAIALLLLGMGFHELSMSPAVVLKVKWAVRRVSSVTMRSVAGKALQCESSLEIHRLLETVRLEIGLDRLTPHPEVDQIQGNRAQQSVITAT
jgi:phosphotransferase system enzyme I (PtsP)